MGAAGLEPAEPEGEGFTVPCNCRYATPPEKLLAKGIEPSTVRLQVGRSTIELRQRERGRAYQRACFTLKGFLQILLEFNSTLQLF